MGAATYAVASDSPAIPRARTFEPGERVGVADRCKFAVRGQGGCNHPLRETEYRDLLATGEYDNSTAGSNASLARASDQPSVSVRARPGRSKFSSQCRLFARQSYRPALAALSRVGDIRVVRIEVDELYEM